MTGVRVGKKVLPADGDVIVYDRPDDDDRCAVCNAKAWGDLDLPVARKPLPVCRRHFYALDGLRWEGRRKRHWAGPATGWIFTANHAAWYWQSDVTACGRRRTAVVVVESTCKVTCETCKRWLERARQAAEREAV